MGVSRERHVAEQRQGQPLDHGMEIPGQAIVARA
jgi:hypothetical protein